MADFPPPPDDDMDAFPSPPGHDGDDFSPMPVPGRKAAPAGKGRAAPLEAFPEGDDDEVTPVRSMRRRAPEPEDEEVHFGGDDGGGAFGDQEDHHADDGEGGFGPDAHAGDDEGFDPDAAHAAADDEPGTDAPEAAKPRVDRSKLVTFGAAGALILFTGFFGWKYVANVIGLDAPPPPQVANVSPMGGMPQPKWAAQNGGNGGVGIPQGLGSPTPGRMAPPMAQPASLPAAPGMPQGMGQALGQGISMKGPGPLPSYTGPAGGAAAPGMGDAPAMPASAMPPANMMGGRDARPAPSVDAATAERIDRLERRIEELSARPAAGGDQIAALAQRVNDVEARAVAPTTPRPSIMPPTKPPVIQGWSLKGVQNGVAWLNGPKGFVEAKVGTDLGEAGRVKSVARYDQDWVVMTDNGVILRK